MADTSFRLLVMNAREDETALRASPQDLGLARAATAAPALSIEARFLMNDDPNMPEALAWADVMLGSRLPRALIAAHGRNLRLIQLINAGIDVLMPLDWLPPGTAFCNASGIHARRLQEWSTMVLLMLQAGMPRFATAQQNGIWSKHTSPCIAGKTVLVFGTGGLGGAVARAGRGLGLKTIGIKRTHGEVPDFDEIVSSDDTAKALGRADFVVLTLPLTPATRGLADAAFFAAMRPGAGFANFGRGALVDQPALCDALEREHLSGAILDVVTPEPLPPDSPLWSTKNLVITPHVSCDDPTTYIADSMRLLLENLRRLQSGEPLKNQIDPVKGY
jgi:phosphoglycerate dehydrogenase-like enzyme